MLHGTAVVIALGKRFPFLIGILSFYSGGKSSCVNNPRSVHFCSRIGSIECTINVNCCPLLLFLISITAALRFIYMRVLSLVTSRLETIKDVHLFTSALFLIEQKLLEFFSNMELMPTQETMKEALLCILLLPFVMSWFQKNPIATWFRCCSNIKQTSA